MATKRNFQWMRNAGVPALEVKWLEGIMGSTKVSHPVAMRRIRDILSLARQGIANGMFKRPVPPALH